MEYLFRHWDWLKKELSGKCIFLFLDYDGTLAPITESPEKAVVSPKIKRSLERLSENPDRTLAIVSGRALDDIKRLVGLKNIIYVANHGLEIEGPNIKFRPPLSVRFKNALKDIKDGLTEKLATIKGALIEDKGMTLSVHYRLTTRRDELAIRNVLHEITRSYSTKGEVRVTHGKKVLEVRPPVNWDKGKACLWLLARERFALKNKEIVPMYIGDDVTDEDAFRALKDKGITVSVGRPIHSWARYYLKDSDEVAGFIERIEG